MLTDAEGNVTQPGVRTSLRIVDRPSKELAEHGTIPKKQLVLRMAKRIRGNAAIHAAMLDLLPLNVWLAEPIIRALCRHEAWRIEDLVALRAELEKPA